MFLLGTENVMRGGWWVVVCVKICGCGKMCDKIETLLDWNKIGVVVYIDSWNMVVVCGSSLW